MAELPNQSRAVSMRSVRSGTPGSLRACSTTLGTAAGGKDARPDEPVDAEARRSAKPAMARSAAAVASQAGVEQRQWRPGLDWSAINTLTEGRPHSRGPSGGGASSACGLGARPRPDADLHQVLTEDQLPGEAICAGSHVSAGRFRARSGGGRACGPRCARPRRRRPRPWYARRAGDRRSPARRAGTAAGRTAPRQRLARSLRDRARRRRCASWIRFSDGAVSPEITTDPSSVSKR